MYVKKYKTCVFEDCITHMKKNSKKNLQGKDDDSSETSSSDTNSKGRQTRLNSCKKDVTTKSAPTPPVKNELFKYNCGKCQFKTNECKDFEEHCLIVHKEKLYFCKVFGCVKHYSSQNGLRMHCKMIHESILKCQHCNVVSLSPELRKQHEESHTDAKITCAGGKRPFTRSNDPAKHWRYVCPKNPNRVIKCRHCLANCNGDEKIAEVEGCEPGMINHLMTIHQLEGDYLCVFCQRLFKTEKILNKHNKSCTKTKPEDPIKYWKD